MRVCTICARGGSKGIKNKNTKLIKGKPLLYYTVKQAIDSKIFDIVAVSSDSDEILEVAKASGAGLIIKRPSEYATDTSAKLPAIKHALVEVEKYLNKKIDVIVDLDCTSPLRSVDDIIYSVKLLEDTKASNVITGTIARRSPYFNLVELQANETVILAKITNPPVVRRQDAPKCYDMNASIYVWTRNGLLDSSSVLQEGTRIYVMPEERSIDIDSDLDFQFVEFLMNQRDDLC